MMLDRGTWLVPTLIAPVWVLEAVEQGAALSEASIRKAVEDLFNVTVLAVNTQNYEGRTKVLRNRRTAKAQDWKRAIVTLKAGDKIDLL